MSQGSGNEERERNARLLGVATAVAAMAAAGSTIGWPAPGISAALGFIVYRLARDWSRGEEDGA